MVAKVHKIYLFAKLFVAETMILSHFCAHSRFAIHYYYYESVCASR